jgi:hypothetical protein
MTVYREEYKIECNNNELTIEGAEYPLGVYSKSNFSIQLSNLQMDRLLRFTKILEDQPLTLEFDLGHNCVFIREAII